MKCKDVRQYWHHRLDECAPDAELDGHLASCESCRRYAAEMLRLVGLFDELQKETESLTSTVTQFDPLATPRPQRGWAASRARIPLRIAAAVLLTVAVGLWYGTEQNAIVEVSLTSGAAPAMGITLRAESREQFIAVATPSDEPNVQTFWLYPMATVAKDQNGPKAQ